MRYALAVEYAGYAFCGFQSQPSRCGVQDALERAVGAIAGHPVGIVAAGRTDAGVHAVSQVVHFDADVERPLSAWVRGVNAHLPAAAAVLWAQPVAPEFHARFAASARHYTYVLQSRPERPALLAGRVGWYHQPLDVAAMQAAAAHLHGTHDFSAFRAAECQAKSPVKTLTRVAVAAQGPFVRFDFSANAFLHHMVRNIVGCPGLRRRRPAAPGVDRRAARRARPHARGADLRGGRALPRRRGLRRALRAAADRARGHAGDRVTTARTRVKICGITRVADGLAAARAGADAIGLVFWGGTPRVVDVGRAREIADALPPFVTKVGLFVDPAPSDVRAVMDAVALDVLQFHGTEAPDLCRAFGRPYLKAIHMKDGVDLVEYAALYEDAAGLLFDSFWPGDLPGGTGRAFDWSRLSTAVQAKLPAPVILSGGLDPDNVVAAIRAVRPWAVDVSSGVEERGPDGKPRRGIKDAARIAAFIEGVRNADD